jgi:prepilin-type N-terminal cleavage/methylation domain-containing protein
VGVRFSSPEPGNSAGFSLIEVLVALVITGLALAAIAGTFGSGLLAHQLSEQAATALALAEEKIAAAGALQPLRPATSGGEFAGRFRWQRTIAPYEDRPDNTATAADQSGAPLRLYRIEAGVAWREGWHNRRLSLATLRLGPPPP